MQGLRSGGSDPLSVWHGETGVALESWLRSDEGWRAHTMLASSSTSQQLRRILRSSSGCCAKTTGIIAYLRYRGCNQKMIERVTSGATLLAIIVSHRFREP